MENLARDLCRYFPFIGFKINVSDVKLHGIGP